MSDARKPELLHCPFCNFNLMSDLIESLHPTGTYLRHVNGWNELIRHDDWQPGDTPLYTVNCPRVSGGCGAEIEGGTCDEVVAAWNRRAPRPEITDAERWQFFREAVIRSGEPQEPAYSECMERMTEVIGNARSQGEIDAAIDAAIREERSRK